ncbi:putative trans-sialidase [Trypanosoma cruzi]|nr:putative trans-sialidase [Trypanosoma cruzi]
MLSRVAAVKAPRTHNRRRVTGSSGMREGRESEPQRLNMSRRASTFAVLRLVVMVMCCGTCGAAHAMERAGRCEGVRVSGSRFGFANWGFQHMCFLSTATCGS